MTKRSEQSSTSFPDAKPIPGEDQGWGGTCGITQGRTPPGSSIAEGHPQSGIRTPGSTSTTPRTPKP